MPDQPRTLGPERAKVGESPWWDAARERLWWVDVQAPAFLWTDLETGQGHSFPTDEMAGGIAGCEDGRLIVAMETGLFLCHPDDAPRVHFLAAPAGLPPTHRFNDLTVDPRGRLIVGTMRKSQLGPLEPTGALYAFDGADWAVLASGFYTINGLAFSPAGDRLYWSDSFPTVNRIWTARYDAATGALGPPAPFVDMNRHRGRPDGAAMDAEGGYWIAAIGGACLHRFRPDGTLDRTIDLPVDHPTKPAFAGRNLDRLAVTSLSIRPGTLDPAAAGALVTLPAPAPGHPVPPVRLAPPY